MLHRYSPEDTQRPEAAVAQLVEHVIRNDGVGGSSPFSGTTLFCQKRDLLFSRLVLSDLRHHYTLSKTSCSLWKRSAAIASSRALRAPQKLDEYYRASDDS